MPDIILKFCFLETRKCQLNKWGYIYFQNASVCVNWQWLYDQYTFRLLARAVPKVPSILHIKFKLVNLHRFPRVFSMPLQLIPYILQFSSSLKKPKSFVQNLKAFSSILRKRSSCHTS